MKIIRKTFYLLYFILHISVFNEKINAKNNNSQKYVGQYKKIYVKSISEIPLVLSKMSQTLEKDINKDNLLILLNTRLLLNFQQIHNNKQKKQTMKSKEIYSTYYKEVEKMNNSIQLPIKKTEYIEIINNLIALYKYFFLCHVSPYHKINYFNNPNVNDKIVLTVNGYKDPICIGNIVYTFFIREEIIIILLCFYKKIDCETVVYITNRDFSTPHINKNQDFVVIIVESDNNKK